MKTKSKRQSQEEVEESSRARFGRGSIVYLGKRPAPADLDEAIGDALRAVEEARREAHSHDAEIARLGEETRRLIAEMLRDLNLRAA
jgi:selenocysteine lyase/cysteine desulfurase